jgi:hypothetical protein
LAVLASDNLVGCVDTAAGRATINQVLELNLYYSRSEIPRVWYLDCGNHATAGQILLGSSLETDPELIIFGDWDVLGCHFLCSKLLTSHLSCAEITVVNVQSESVNVRVAAEVADYLYRMAAGHLKRFTTYLIWIVERRDRSIILLGSNRCAAFYCFTL